MSSARGPPTSPLAATHAAEQRAPQSTRFQRRFGLEDARSIAKNPRESNAISTFACVARGAHGAIASRASTRDAPSRVVVSAVRAVAGLTLIIGMLAA